LKQAQDKFTERTGGGIGGTQWMAPLLPKDFAPPIDLRWPEYIQTARGEEWWIRPRRQARALAKHSDQARRTALPKSVRSEMRDRWLPWPQGEF
jgi:hypothetical protein